MVRRIDREYPEDYEQKERSEIERLLGRIKEAKFSFQKGVLSQDLASKLASVARLRNLLVHRYWTIADEKVYESVKKGLKDFEDFITHVRKFLERGEKVA